MDLVLKFQDSFHRTSHWGHYSGQVMSLCALNTAPVTKSVSGQHIDNKTNKDVKELFFPAMTTIAFPKGVQLFFPNIAVLRISHCNLREITRQDLTGLHTLEVLEVIYNLITSLPNDLFNDTPKIRQISLNNNRIEKLSSKVFNCLKWESLTCIDLRHNSKINVIFVRSDHPVVYFDRGNNDGGRCVTHFKTLREQIDRDCDSELNARELELSDMFYSGIKSDFSIKADGAKWNLHRSVLAGRSPVFEAMLRSGMQEDRTNQLKIIDFSAAVVQEMVRFVYIDEIRHEDIIIDLFGIATKYNISGLEQLCEETIIENMDESNVIDILRVGNLYSSDAITKAAFGKIVKMFPGINMESQHINDPDRLQKMIDLKKKYDLHFNFINART